MTVPDDEKGRLKLGVNAVLVDVAAESASALMEDALLRAYVERCRSLLDQQFQTGSYAHPELARAAKDEVLARFERKAGLRGGQR